MLKNRLHHFDYISCYDVWFPHIPFLKQNSGYFITRYFIRYHGSIIIELPLTILKASFNSKKVLLYITWDLEGTSLCYYQLNQQLTRITVFDGI